MILDKVDMLKHEICQREANIIAIEFRRALQKHFKTVDANAARLIKARKGGQD